MANAKPSGSDRPAKEIVEPVKEIGREAIKPIPGKRWDGTYDLVTEECMTPQLAERGKGPLIRKRGQRTGDLPERGKK